jgi:hypothetical protein
VCGIHICSLLLRHNSMQSCWVLLSCMWLGNIGTGYCVSKVPVAFCLQPGPTCINLTVNQAKRILCALQLAVDSKMLPSTCQGPTLFAYYDSSGVFLLVMLPLLLRCPYLVYICQHECTPYVDGKEHCQAQRAC